MRVTGPSLSRATFISAPKTPVSTRAPRSRRADTTASTSGAATGPGAAADQDPQAPELGGELRGLLRGVLVGDADQDEEAWLVDRSHDVPIHGHAGPAHSLHDSPHSTAEYPASAGAGQAARPGLTAGRTAGLHPAVTLLTPLPAFFHPLHQPGPPGQPRPAGGAGGADELELAARGPDPRRMPPPGDQRPHQRKQHDRRPGRVKVHATGHYPRRDQPGADQHTDEGLHQFALIVH